MLYNFKHEHKIFKNQFIFKGNDYQKYLVTERNKLHDFIWEFGLQEHFNVTRGNPDDRSVREGDVGNNEVEDQMMQRPIGQSEAEALKQTMMS